MSCLLGNQPNLILISSGARGFLFQKACVHCCWWSGVKQHYWDKWHVRHQFRLHVGPGGKFEEGGEKSPEDVLHGCKLAA